MSGFVNNFFYKLDRSINNLEYYLNRFRIFLTQPQQPNIRVIYKRRTFDHHHIYKNLYCDYLVERKNNFEKHKNKFRKCLNDIVNHNSMIYWVYNNNIKEILKYKLVILDFQSIYDYKNKKELNMEYLKNLSKYLLDNKIIFCIVSEINPKYFPKFNYFNTVNLITPYHYKKKSFGGVVRIGINKFSDKSVEVGLNKIIIDIMNQYGCNDEEIVYINSKKLENINTIII